jgi:hypothetical protein
MPAEFPRHHAQSCAVLLSALHVCHLVLLRSAVLSRWVLAGLPHACAASHATMQRLWSVFHVGHLSLHVEQLTCICRHQRQHWLRVVATVADACMHACCYELQECSWP